MFENDLQCALLAFAKGFCSRAAEKRELYEAEVTAALERHGEQVPFPDVAWGDLQGILELCATDDDDVFAKIDVLTHQDIGRVVQWCEDAYKGLSYRIQPPKPGARKAFRVFADCEAAEGSEEYKAAMDAFLTTVGRVLLVSPQFV